MDGLLDTFAMKVSKEWMDRYILFLFFLTPNQPWRLYQGKTPFVRTQCMLENRSAYQTAFVKTQCMVGYLLVKHLLSEHSAC